MAVLFWASLPTPTALNAGFIINLQKDIFSTSGPQKVKTADLCTKVVLYERFNSRKTYIKNLAMSTGRKYFGFTLRVGAPY